jgi:hypothetical protein
MFVCVCIHVYIERLDMIRAVPELAVRGYSWASCPAVTGNSSGSTAQQTNAVCVWRFRTSETRFHLSTEARNTIQEAVLNIQTAQDILPGVQFPYCTTREMSAVLQVGLV